MEGGGEGRGGQVVPLRVYRAWRTLSKKDEDTTHPREHPCKARSACGDMHPRAWQCTLARHTCVFARIRGFSCDIAVFSLEFKRCRATKISVLAARASRYLHATNFIRCVAGCLGGETSATLLGMGAAFYFSVCWTSFGARMS